MEIKTYRAKSMYEALAMVKQELGPEASVLHTREVSGNVFTRLAFGPRFEVSASASVNVPSRLPVEAVVQQVAEPSRVDLATAAEIEPLPTMVTDDSTQFRDEFRNRISGRGPDSENHLAQAKVFLLGLINYLMPCELGSQSLFSKYGQERLTTKH